MKYHMRIPSLSNRRVSFDTWHRSLCSVLVSPANAKGKRSLLAGKLILWLLAPGIELLHEEARQVRISDFSWLGAEISQHMALV